MIPKRYIPINKGHFDLDTEARTRQFSEKLRTGWEDAYRTYRRLWVELPNARKVREYPLLLDLEMSSVCNLHCPMCPTCGEEYLRRVEKKFLDFRIFKKCVDEAAGHIYSLRLSLVGEPTLHSRLIDAIAYAKQKGIREVSFLTNGSRLTLDYFKEMVAAGVDWITVSIDGIHQEYEKIRRPLKFEETLDKLRAIHAYKTEHGLDKPVIKVQGVWPAIRPNPTGYYDLIAPLVDLVAYNPLIDYLHRDSEIVYEDNFACSQLYQRLVICSDGKAKMCSNDEYRAEIVGDVAKETLHAIWHGEAMEKIRQVHENYDGFKTMATCRSCYYPRKAVPDEKAVVGNREIWIQNYINRKQEIGQ